MKKLFTCILTLLMLFSISSKCSAGDVPESLLNDDAAQVFFGEVKEVLEDSITVIQHQNIKGEFTNGKELTYFYNLVYTKSPEVGEIYLLGHIDEDNSIYVWEVSSLDTDTLEIPHADSMTKRMQQYLNDGSFEEKEKERLSKTENEGNTKLLPVTTERIESADSTETVADAELSGKDSPANNIFTLFLILSGIVLVGIIVLFWKNWKKRNQ